jgi:hypothetical protein
MLATLLYDVLRRDELCKPKVKDWNTRARIVSTTIGQLWADKSQGKGVFLMVQMQDVQGRGLKARIDAALA